MSVINPQTVADERVVTVDDGAQIAASIPSTVVNVGVPTQVANPSRASWRTFVQSALAFLVVANVAAALAVQFLNTPDGAALLALLPANVVAVLFSVLNAVVLVGSTLAKLVSILMANPTVNEWISTHLSFLAPIKPTK